MVYVLTFYLINKIWLISIDFIILNFYLNIYLIENIKI